MKYLFAAVVLIMAAFATGFYFHEYANLELSVFLADQSGENTSTAGLIPVNVSIDGNTVSLQNNCNAISFDVTDDQAYSISHGIENTTTTRPLTHDIFRDVIENFGIRVVQIKVDRYEDGVYKASMLFSKDNRTLDLDVRPSDAMAMAARLGQTLYIDQSIMMTKSTKVC